MLRSFFYHPALFNYLLPPFDQRHGEAGFTKNFYDARLLHVPLFFSPYRRDTSDEAGKGFEKLWGKMALADPGRRTYDRNPFPKKFPPRRKSLSGDAFQRLSWNDAPNHAESVRVRRNDFPLSFSSSPLSEDLLGMNFSPLRCPNCGEGRGD